MLKINIPLRVWLTLVALIVFCLLLIGYCSQREKAAGLKDQAVTTDARGKSAGEAIAAIADNNFVNHQTREEAARAQDLIRQADPADRDRVARRELCKLQGGTSC